MFEVINKRGTVIAEFDDFDEAVIFADDIKTNMGVSVGVYEDGALCYKP